MILKLFLNILALHLVQSYPYYPECSSIDPQLNILNTLNGKIQGTCYNVTVNYGKKPKSTNQVMTWLSIPYAEPPIGQLTYKKSIPVKSWLDTKNGKVWPNKCLQEYGVKTANSEDCLYLNIFVPFNVYNNKNKTKAPIFFWIHGGKLTKGSSDEDILEPSTFVAMSNIIVVNINYRLGIYGFLHIKDTDAIGNQAISDQNLALKWVYENAANFGGDNQRITIGGQSAGSWSVGYHLLYKPSWPYFRNAILESGNPLESGSKQLKSSDESTTLSFNIGKDLNCFSDNQYLTNQQLFECIQSKKINETKYVSSFYWSFPPVVNNGIDFTEDPEISFKNGNIKPCNILTGSNTKERAFFEKSAIRDASKYTKSNLTSDLLSYFAQSLYRYKVLNITERRDLVNKVIQMYETSQLNLTSPLDYLIQIITDERYKCPAYALSEIYSKRDSNVFTYLYGYHISTSRLSEQYEAVHQDELAMVYGEPLSVKIPPLLDSNEFSSTCHNYSIDERLISERIVNYWSNFIKTDNPNDKNSLTDLKWIGFNEESYIHLRNVLYLNANLTNNVNYWISDTICSFFSI